MNDKLQEIKIENIVIIIYYILLTIYLYANNIEVNYLKYSNPEDKERYRLLLYIVFGTTFIITLFYTIESIMDLNNENNYEISKLQKLSALANLLILFASIIIIYIIYKDKNIDLEVNP